MDSKTDFGNIREEGAEIEKQILEQYAQAMRESEDLKNRIRLIDAEIQNLDLETDVVSAGKKGRRSLGRAKASGHGRNYSEKKTALLQLRMSYLNLQAKLSAMACDVEEYIQRIDDSRMRQIMRLRYTKTQNGKQMTWRDVAQHMGETEDSCRKAHDRWLMQNR